jgi:hypothetical protein
MVREIKHFKTFSSSVLSFQSQYALTENRSIKEFFRQNHEIPSDLGEIDFNGQKKCQFLYFP